MKHLSSLLLTLCCAAEAGAQISLIPVGRFAAAGGGYDKTAAEIPSYDPVSRRLFVVNSNTQSVDVTDISDPANPVALPSIVLGADPNSVAVRNGVIAVSVNSPVSRQAPGEVRFYGAGGATPFLTSQTVGAIPDMVSFSPDGAKLLVANEGEPNFYGGPNSVDPEGSISIIGVSFPNPGEISVNSNITAGFSAFNGAGAQAALQAQGGRIFGPGATVAQDLEPEYITISADSGKAYVTLQENNAIATVDLATGTVTAVSGLGTKNHSLPGNAFDGSDRDGPGDTALVNIIPHPVESFYAPDGVAVLERGGRTFLVTANEGDYREYAAPAGSDGVSFKEEARLSTVDLDDTTFGGAEAVLKGNGPDGLGRLNITTANGDTDGDGDLDTIHMVGSRSFSVFEVNSDGSIALRFDSGDDFEQALAGSYPANFNVSSTNNTLDARSPSKGPEPESLVLGEYEGLPLAFIATERAGEIFTYDMSDPLHPVMLSHVNTRDFLTAPGEGAGGDLAPEGMLFISAADSPTGSPLLAVSYETSGTTVLFSIGPDPRPVPETLPVWIPFAALTGLFAAHRVRRANRATA